MPSSRRFLPLFVFAAIMVVVCVGVAFVSVRYFAPDYRDHDGPEGHGWIHRQLDLTPEEAAQVDAFEQPYRAEKARLQAEFDTRVQRLAQLLETRNEYSREVTDTVAELHHFHGQIQQLAIKHYFQMLGALPPDKQAKLRRLAVDALSMPE